MHIRPEGRKVKLQITKGLSGVMHFSRWGEILQDSGMTGSKRDRKYEVMNTI